MTADVDEQCEVLSLIGDVAIGDDGAPSVHAHITLGKRDFTSIGGHLVAGEVWPTLELVLQESPEHLQKRRDRGVSPVSTTSQVSSALVDTPLGGARTPRLLQRSGCKERASALVG